MFYTRRRHLARVVSIGCGAVVSFVTIEIVQMRCDTSSGTVRTDMLYRVLVWSESVRRKSEYRRLCSLVRFLY